MSACRGRSRSSTRSSSSSFFSSSTVMYDWRMFSTVTLAGDRLMWAGSTM
jgi:hypothetical protein